MVVEISGIERLCIDLHDKYSHYKSRGASWWISLYWGYYSKALEVANKIKAMSFKSEEEVVNGAKYFVDIQTLDAYLDLYKLLKSIPKTEIRIYSPERIFVSERISEFCQVE